MGKCVRQFPPKNDTTPNSTIPILRYLAVQIQIEILVVRFQYEGTSDFKKRVDWCKKCV